MKKIVLSIFLILLFFPISSSFAQKTDTLPTLSVMLTSKAAPFVYQDEQGYTVVVGEVKNTNTLTSVTDVRIRAIFYGDTNPQPLEIVEGTSALQVIPPLGTSPYIIKSKTPNSEITQASVSLGSFDSSTSKSKQLSVAINNINLDDTLHFSGVLKNGAAPSNNTNVYLAFYDNNFEPPRIIDVITIPFGNVESNEAVNFNFNEKIQSRSGGFTVSAESNVFYSQQFNMIIPELSTKLVTISKVSILDKEGKNLPEIKVGSTVVIQSDTWIQFSADQKTNETPYTYYVQIKQSGTPFVEFIGKYDGRYIETGQQSPSVDWIPETSGLFFIETFVWDRNNVPIANPGPIVLIIVN